MGGLELLIKKKEPQDQCRMMNGTAMPAIDVATIFASHVIGGSGLNPFAVRVINFIIVVLVLESSVVPA